MSGYNNERHGALFKNDKGDNPKRPDYRGTCQLNGVTFVISAWLSDDRNGSKYMRLKFEPKAAPPLTQPVRDVPAKTQAAFDDDIPF